MKKGGFYFSTVDRLFRWAQASSLWYVSTGTTCCADEWASAAGSKYDLERFGCLPQVDPRQADLLVITGAVTYKAARELREVYDAMIAPKYVIAIGGCACGGGAVYPSVQLFGGAGSGSDPSRRCLCAGLPAPPRSDHGWSDTIEGENR